MSTIKPTPASIAKSTDTNVASELSKFHLLIPASGTHFRLCRALASSTLLGYPVPVLNGWLKPGELDASKTHLAKVRTVMQYLDSLPASSDDDLVLMIDGYDIVFQVPPDVLIDRYFEVTRAASAKLAARFNGESIEALLGEDKPRQTILFGPEKICYPVDWNRIGCWAIPEDIDIPVGAYGPDDGSLDHNLPRWLNSGTIMGPARDMRLMFAATLARIQERYDANHEFSDSDQMYMSDVWGEQEYWRSVKELEFFFHGDVDPKRVVPDDKDVPIQEPTQKYEYHIGIDYRSALFQTRVGSDHALEMLYYNDTADNATTHVAWAERSISEAPNFQPFPIHLPSNLARSITRLLASIAHVVESIPSVSELALDTNLVTQNVYGMFHCTGEKDYIDDLWHKLWFYPYARPLFEAAVASLQKGDSIGVSNGRRWAPAHVLPSHEPGVNGVQAAGAWADIDGGWLKWEELCGEFEGEVFGQ